MKRIKEIMLMVGLGLMLASCNSTTVEDDVEPTTTDNTTEDPIVEEEKIGKDTVYIDLNGGCSYEYFRTKTITTDGLIIDEGYKWWRIVLDEDEEIYCEFMFDNLYNVQTGEEKYNPLSLSIEIKGGTKWSGQIASGEDYIEWSYINDDN